MAYFLLRLIQEIRFYVMDTLNRNVEVPQLCFVQEKTARVPKE